MSSDQLFEDCDLDEAEIFGNREQLIPRAIPPPTDEKDPLRKPKIALSALLVAEKEALTVKQIENRMLNDDGVVMDSKKYGFPTLESLLIACPDVIIHRLRNDGVHVYTAKRNEALLDIAEMVQAQKGRADGLKTSRSFFGRSSGMGTHGASFRAYSGPTRVDSTNSGTANKGFLAQLNARKNLGPCKTIARVRNVADVIRNCRSEIGIPHPEVPGRNVVQLAKLQQKFNQIYGLPIWVKPMNEKELHAALDQPEFAGVLKFYRVNELIYVDGGEEEEQTLDVTTPESVEENKHFDSFSSINDNTSQRSELNRSDVLDVSHFAHGPGFSEDVCDKSIRMAELAATFGVPSAGNLTTNVIENSMHSGSRNTTFNDEMSSITEPVTVSKPISAFNPAFEGRSITPKNALKILVEYVKSRGNVTFESLPDGDQMLVNTNKNIFSLKTTNPGDLFVQLVDPQIDPLTVTQTDTLQDPVEKNVRWLSKVRVNTTSRVFAKPIAFVAPRGFVLMTNRKEVSDDEKSSKLNLMGSLLRKSMQDPLPDLEKEDAIPGAAAVLLHQEAQTVTYFRVLIMGAGKNDGDISVLLADAENQHFVDTTLTNLFPMPEKAGFNLYPPNIVFASIYGVFGLSESEQENLRKNFEDEERKRFIVTVFRGDQEREEMVSADLVFVNEFGRLEWLSQILKRRGAVMTAENASTHLTKDLQSAMLKIEEQVMEFIDFVDETVPKREVVSMNVTPIRDESEEMNVLYKLFQSGIESNDCVLIVSMAQMVKRAIEKHEKAGEWTDFMQFIRQAAKRNGFDI